MLLVLLRGFRRSTYPFLQTEILCRMDQPLATSNAFGVGPVPTARTLDSTSIQPTPTTLIPEFVHRLRHPLHTLAHAEMHSPNTKPLTSVTNPPRFFNSLEIGGTIQCSSCFVQRQFDISNLSHEFPNVRRSDPIATGPHFIFLFTVRRVQPPQGIFLCRTPLLPLS